MQRQDEYEETKQEMMNNNNMFQRKPAKIKLMRPGSIQSQSLLMSPDIT